MKKKLLFIFNPKSGKGLIKEHLVNIVDIMTKAGYKITIYPTPVSYTHLTLPTNSLV